MWLFVWLNLPRKLVESFLLIGKLKSDLDLFRAKFGYFLQGNSKWFQSELAVEELRLVPRHYSWINDSISLFSFILSPAVVVGQGLWPFRSLFPWQQVRDTGICQWPLPIPAGARTCEMFRNAFSWFLSHGFTSVWTYLTTFHFHMAYRASNQHLLCVKLIPPTRRGLDNS